MNENLDNLGWRINWNEMSFLPRIKVWDKLQQESSTISFWIPVYTGMTK